MKDKVYLAAIDAGTTGERTIIFDTKGSILVQQHSEHSSFYPKPAWVEQDASEWWKCVCKTSRAVLKLAARKGIIKEMIIGLSVTNQRETIVPVDKNTDPLRKAIVWQDRRSLRQCEWIRKNVGSDFVYNTTGLTVDPYFSAPKIRWIKEEEPAVYRKAHKFLLVHDYLIAKLTDSFVTSWDNASRTMLFDIKSLRWSEKLLDSTGIDGEKMPEPHPPGDEIGEISDKAATETGFARSTKIFCGGGDQQCSALGSGVTRSGRAVCTTGTGTFLLAYSDKPLLDPKKRILCSCHAVPGKWVLEASVLSTGAIYKWFRDQFGLLEKYEAEKARIDPYEILNREAAASPAGSNGVLLIPHFVGAGAPHWNPDARGVVFGLALGNSRNDVIRAILEGICLEIRKSIEVMKELGINMKDVRVTGGMSKSSIFNQIQADVYDLPVVREETSETTALGCAILVGLGTGVFRNIQDATDKTFKVSEEYHPTRANQEKYERLFKLHKKIYEIFEKLGVYNDLSRLQI